MWLQKAAAQCVRWTYASAVGDDELVDHGAIWHRRSIPFASDRIGVDGKRLVCGPDTWPPEIGSCRSCGHGRHEPAPRIAELRPLISTELDTIAILMDIAMVMTAQQTGIIERCLSTISPMLDMMSFQEDLVFATRIRACGVALEQRALDRTGDRAALASDRQRYAVRVLDHLDHAGVAAEPTCGLDSNARSTHAPDGGGVSRAGAQIGHWNRDHHVDRRAIRSVTAQVRLDDREQRVGAVERSRRRIGCLAQATHRTHRSRLR